MPFVSAVLEDWEGHCVMNSSADENVKRNTRISRARFFAEPPPEFSIKFSVSGLPKNFVQDADKELNLDGDLISYVESLGDFEIELITRLEDEHRHAFFSTKAKEAILWAVYYGIGESGCRYSVLVEYGKESKEVQEEISRIMAWGK
jgi:hypothetical protein